MKFIFLILVFLGTGCSTLQDKGAVKKLDFYINCDDNIFSEKEKINLFSIAKKVVEENGKYELAMAVEYRDRPDIITMSYDLSPSKRSMAFDVDFQGAFYMSYYNVPTDYESVCKYTLKLMKHVVSHLDLKPESESEWAENNYLRSLNTINGHLKSLEQINVQNGVSAEEAASIAKIMLEKMSHYSSSIRGLVETGQHFIFDVKVTYNSEWLFQIYVSKSNGAVKIESKDYGFKSFDSLKKRMIEEREKLVENWRKQ